MNELTAGPTVATGCAPDDTDVKFATDREIGVERSWRRHRDPSCLEQFHRTAIISHGRASGTASTTQSVIWPISAHDSTSNIRVSLGPEFIKLDVTLTRAVNTDPLSEAMVRALCCFAEQTSASVIAEGVETEADLVAVRRLGIGLAQGYLLGRPLAHAPTLGAQSAIRRLHADGKRAQL